MEYYYFHPRNKQYLFSEHYKEYELLRSMYQSYTLGGRIAWFLFNRSRRVRQLWRAKDVEKIPVLEVLQKVCPADTVFVINKGTGGVEQKTTALGYIPSVGEAVFFKYANTAVACNNVRNEAEALRLLHGKSFAPQLLAFVDAGNYCYLKTTVLQGQRLCTHGSDADLLHLLYSIAAIKHEQLDDSDLKVAWAHGDFCPWNMMLSPQNELLVYDWEMAGIQPLGYDLFCYLFQTSFLLQPRRNVSSVLQYNHALITSYFSHYAISDYSQYLKAFAQIKIEKENEKGSVKIRTSYEKLLQYVEKI